MKTFLKISAVLFAFGVLLVALLLQPFWGWFYDSEIAAIKLENEKEIVFLAIEDDGPSAWAEIVFKADGKETDRIPVAFLIEDRSDISHRITITQQTKELIEFRYTSEFEIIDYAADLTEGVFIKNNVKIRSTDQFSNKSSQTTPAKRPLFRYDPNPINHQTTRKPT